MLNHDIQDRKEKESFFGYFYLAINIGSLIASTLVVYLQDNVSWTIGFGVPGAIKLQGKAYLQLAYLLITATT